ncbi:MAG: amidohydrolase [Desulfobulbaceae bacterium]|nr:MAG: amidohydrolase [Desulfobulbaceae bacterium]
MIDIRRHIHRYPELSLEEFETSRYIQKKLNEIGIQSSIRTAGTGVVAVLGNEPDAPNKVGLRADIDGLPVQEESGLEFASLNQGVMHACGHDGHVAMLLGAAALLKRTEDIPGGIKLIFQPAEEHGNGALRLIEEGLIDDVEVIFGGHIDTHFQTGQITVDSGLICAYTDPFQIVVNGRGGHAARPHEAADAVVAASSLVMMLQSIVSRHTDPNKAEVITIGSFQAGSVHNVIAGEAVLKGTIRSTDSQTRIRTMAGVERIVQSIAMMHDVEVKLVFEEPLPAVINAECSTETARTAAWDVTSFDNVISQGCPSLGGEDFAFYQQQIEGCLVRFGGGVTDREVGPSHSKNFDFDEHCLPYGAHWLASVALHWLKRQGTRVPI